MGASMTRTKELANNGQSTRTSIVGESLASSDSTLSTLKSENVTAPSWYGQSQKDVDSKLQRVEEQESPSVLSQESRAQSEIDESPLMSEGTLTPMTPEKRRLLDETVRPYVDPQNNVVYYESLKSTKSTTVKASPKLGASDDLEASSTDDATPKEGILGSESPIPTSVPTSSQPNEEAPVGKYPYPEFTTIENFETYLSGAPEMSAEELYHRTSVVQQALWAYQKEWLAVDKKVYEWEDADKSRLKIVNDEQKAQADQDQAEDDAKMIELASEYKSYLAFSRRDWTESFTKQYEEQYEEMDAPSEAKARATLVLLNKLRDPFYMKSFHRRQKALQSQGWDSKLVEKPLPESKQSKEEKDLDERKRKYLTDRITFDDMSRADAYGYTYNAMDLSRGDQKLPNLRVIAKNKASKRNSKEAELEIDIEAPRPKRARKGPITESGDNSEAASATEEETPLPEKRRGRGQNVKLAEVNAGLIAAAEAAKKAAAKTYVDEGGVRRYVNSHKPSGRPTTSGTAAAKGKGRAAAKSKLDQMSRAASESEEDLNDFKRKLEDEELDAPASKRARVSNSQLTPELLTQPTPTMHSISSILNSEPLSVAAPLPIPKQRKRPIQPTAFMPSPTTNNFPSNPDTAENSEDDGLGGKKTKKSRLKTELERKVQSDAMKENWKDPTGKMRMGIERRNRRAGRKKFENTRITNGGVPNPNVIYKSDDEGFSYAYFNETPPAPTPPAPPAQQALVPVGYAMVNPMTVTSTTPSLHSSQHFPTMGETMNHGLSSASAPTPSLLPGMTDPPPKKVRAKRPRPIKTNSNGSGSRKAASTARNEKRDEDESESDSSMDGPSLYEQFQQIMSPTGGVDLGKRKSIQRQPVLTYGTTSGEDDGEASDFQ